MPPTRTVGEPRAMVPRRPDAGMHVADASLRHGADQHREAAQGDRAADMRHDAVDHRADLHVSDAGGGLSHQTVSSGGSRPAPPAAISRPLAEEAAQPFIAPGGIGAHRGQRDRADRRGAGQMRRRGRFRLAERRHRIAAPERGDGGPGLRRCRNWRAGRGRTPRAGSRRSACAPRLRRRRRRRASASGRSGGVVWRAHMQAHHTHSRFGSACAISFGRVGEEPGVLQIARCARAAIGVRREQRGALSSQGGARLHVRPWRRVKLGKRFAAHGGINSTS